jgi:threonine/homoserine/homoserine lactone efflux protein
MNLVPFETVVAFATTCLVIELTPGPNMGYLAFLTATQGRRAGTAAALGVGLGLLTVGLAAALGLAAIISNSYILYELLRWGGVAYLLWLSWEAWQTAVETSPGKADPADDQQAKHFTRGLVTNLLNPKAGLFYIAILPTFVDPTMKVFAQTVHLSVIYVAIATMVHMSIVLLTGTARPFLEGQHNSRIVRRVMAFVLAGIAFWFGVATSR